MALTQETVPYELIARFNDDGSFQAAQLISRVLILNDGEIYTSFLLPPEEFIPEANAVLNKAQTKSANEITKLKKEIKDLQDQLRIALMAGPQVTEGAE